MRRAAFLVALASVLSLTPLMPGAPSSPVAAAPSDPIAIVVEGTGFGHGRGMSQWGAYGWAVDQNKTWQWILDHYYGGTTLGDVNTAQARIRVRLLGLDNLTTFGVTTGSGTVTAGGVSRRSLYVTEISANRFQIYGSTSMACPTSVALVVPSGTIAQGSTNATAVRQIQTFLNAFQATGTPLAVDGAFGALTAARLREWQTARGLTVDGIWHAADATAARAQINAATSSASWALLTTVNGPVTFTTAGGETSSAAPGNVLGACDAAGRVTHYRGKLEIHNVAAESNQNRVVNDVKTEDYLRGVVPKEISANWANAGGGKGANAVRAQAVAARSYGLQQSRYTYAGTCDSQSCQVYGGAATRATATTSAVSVEHALTNAAITATAGKVRKWPNGSIVSTEFSASNGPRTAGGAFPPVDDTLGDRTASNPNHRWTRVLDAGAVAQKYGLGALTGASMVESSNATYRQFDGIWFNDVAMTGTAQNARVDAWKFRGDFGLPSPGFTIRIVTRDTTPKTFGLIGDSVGDSIAGSPTGEFSTLIDGTFSSARIDTYGARCTVTTSCPGTSGLEAAAQLPMGLDLVVVQLGYNDWPPSFAGYVEQMMAALAARDVGQVAWVNLSTGGNAAYATSNAALVAAQSRWSNLSILDWNAASNTAERSRWFTSDKVHLTATGQAKFAIWLRQQVLELTPVRRLAPPRKIELPVVGQTVTAANGTVSTIPANVTAVSVNVTAVLPDAAGFVTVWPCAQARPLTSNLNYSARGIDNNGVIAPVDATGKTCLYANVATDVVVDITGWFGPSTGSGYVASTPHRAADSRTGVGIPRRRVTPSAPVELQVTGLAVRQANGQAATIPANALAAAVNITAVNPSTAGFITAWPCGVPRPLVSSLNYAAGSVRGNGAMAPLGAGGKLCIYSLAPTDVVVDIVGWYTPAAPVATSAFVPGVPARWVDTREGLGAPRAPVAPARPLQIPAVGRRLLVGGAQTAIPATATAVAVNVTVVSPAQGAFATVWPCGTTRPLTSSVNYAAGAITSNNVIAPIGSDGTICLYTHTNAHVVVDVAGWFNATPAFSGVVPDRLVDTRYGVGPVPA